MEERRRRRTSDGLPGLGANGVLLEGGEEDEGGDEEEGEADVGGDVVAVPEDLRGDDAVAEAGGGDALRGVREGPSGQLLLPSHKDGLVGLREEGGAQAGRDEAEVLDGAKLVHRHVPERRAHVELLLEASDGLPLGRLKGDGWTNL